MAGNTIGQIFRLTSFGESHGKAIGGIIDGCPSGLTVDIEFVQAELSRRRPGQSEITTSRTEEDRFEILSGVFDGLTTGAPIGFIIPNKDQNSSDYEHLKSSFRPSHADFTYETKYGVRDHRGGGRSSARETAARVFAGAIAKLVLKAENIQIFGYVSQVGAVKLDKHYDELDLGNIESSMVRCPDKSVAEKMVLEIEQAKTDGDTIGGMISGVVKGVPAGLGEPVFDKLHADLGKAMLGINAVKGFDYGSGFSAIEMKGSEHNDIFENKLGVIDTITNNSGGIQGGISNGQDIYFNVAFKPVATIMKSQVSVDKDGNKVQVDGKGRHDPCVVPRAVPIVEAMAALVLVDHFLRQKSTRI